MKARVPQSQPVFTSARGFGVGQRGSIHTGGDRVALMQGAAVRSRRYDEEAPAVDNLILDRPTSASHSVGRASAWRGPSAPRGAVARGTRDACSGGLALARERWQPALVNPRTWGDAAGAEVVAPTIDSDRRRLTGASSRRTVARTKRGIRVFRQLLSPAGRSCIRRELRSCRLVAP